jgi:hypothetical protein
VRIRYALLIPALAAVCTLIARAADTSVSVAFMMAALALWVMSAFFGALLLLLAVHELGHFVAGWALGWRFRGIQVGPLKLECRRTGRRRYEDPKGWLSGHVYFIAHPPFDSRARYAGLVLAGPLASATLVAILAAALPFVQGEVATAVLWIFIGSASLFVILPLIPHTYEGQPSDGLLLWKILTRWRWLHRRLAVARLVDDAARLVPADQWSERDLQQIMEDPADAEAYDTGLLYRFYQAILSDPSAARERIEQLLERTPANSAASSTVRGYAAYWFGWHEGNAVRARDLFGAIKEFLPEDGMLYCQAESAVFYAEGKYREAEATAERALKNAHRDEGEWNPHPEEIREMERLRDAARSRLVQSEV